MRAYWNSGSRGPVTLLLTWLLLFAAGSALAQTTGSAKLRIVSWNIENRPSVPWPQRSPADTRLIAERIRSWEPAVLVLQEMADTNWRRTLVNELGSTWRGYFDGAPGEMVLVWDTSRVTLLEAEYLNTLAQPPYTPYPDHSPFPPGFPHGRPVTGVFRMTGSDPGNMKPFRVIGLHCHPDVDLAEATWLRTRVLEWLGKPDESMTKPGTTHDIILGGDLNAGLGPNDFFHTVLQEGGYLYLVRKENGESTTIGPWAIDHFYVTQAARARLFSELSFVVRPEQYGETPEYFDTHYSDHLPIFLDLGRVAATRGWEMYY